MDVVLKFLLIVLWRRQKGKFEMKPYYSHAGLCKCGCGSVVSEGRMFISGHNLKHLKKTESHKNKIAKAQKESWKNNNERLCFGRQPRKPVGSKTIDAHGYVLVKEKDGAAHWKKEHILIIENVIGRKLIPGEVIHHINGNRADNREENLFLCSNMSEHNNIEKTVKRILKELIDDGVIKFDRENKRYERIL